MEFLQAIPTWAIIAGAVVILIIGLFLIGKIASTVLKVILIIILISVITGGSIGLSKIPARVENAVEKAGEYIGEAGEYIKDFKGE